MVWLETLDMEPLSKGINLFAAILARIEQELDASLEQLPPLAAALAKSDGYASATDKLRQLQNDAARVWDRSNGGVSNDDPQIRALWIIEAEKAGLSFNSRIGEVLDGIARARWNSAAPSVRVSIGSDDPITFATSLPEEYQLLADALSDAGVAGPDVDAWLEAARHCGLTTKFTAPRSIEQLDRPICADTFPLPL